MFGDKTKCIWSTICRWNAQLGPCRFYSRRTEEEACRRGCAELPPKVDPVCHLPVKRMKPKKDTLLQRIKLKIVDGGTNFGTSFNRLRCKKKPCPEKEEEPKALSPPKPRPPVPVQDPRPGVQISILGADTTIGEYVAFILKQCPYFSKLRLYEARMTYGATCERGVKQIVDDLKHINTNCLVNGYTRRDYELNKCLQNTDIVLILDDASIDASVPWEERFESQAPMVKRYADAIAADCPRAFVIVNTSPIDCMVPLIAETLKETGWYDPRKLLGSLAVPEMRARTLAAEALSLEPWYTQVPCVGGTEGDTLVPLFSKAVEFFEFNQNHASMMTSTVRLQSCVPKKDENQKKAAHLSEAHALGGLVKRVAQALLCMDVPVVSGYVENDPAAVSPFRYLASPVTLGGRGIVSYPGLPKMSDMETLLTDQALVALRPRLGKVQEWYDKQRFSSKGSKKWYFSSKNLQDCAYEHV